MPNLYNANGSVPKGTINITSNGQHDVKKYAVANVDITRYNVGAQWYFYPTLYVSQMGGYKPLAIYVTGQVKDGNEVSPGVIVNTNLGNVATMIYGWGAMGNWHTFGAYIFLPYTPAQLNSLTYITVTVQAYQTQGISCHVCAWI